VLQHFREPGGHFGLISYIAGMGPRGPSRPGNFRRNSLRIFRADIKNVDGSTIRRELVRDGAANPAAAASDDRSFPIKAEFARASIVYVQRETPRFQGMKSS
jgi:hypothetical protein